jgi:hypothetical protein
VISGFREPDVDFPDELVGHVDFASPPSHCLLASEKPLLQRTAPIVNFPSDPHVWWPLVQDAPTAQRARALDGDFGARLVLGQQLIVIENLEGHIGSLLVSLLTPDI